MTEQLLKAVWNGDTGETEYVPLTEEELAQREADAAAFAAAEAEREATEAAKAAALASANAKLEAIGLTPEEIAALKG